MPVPRIGSVHKAIQQDYRAWYAPRGGLEFRILLGHIIIPAGSTPTYRLSDVEPVAWRNPITEWQEKSESNWNQGLAVTTALTGAG
jgi:hypothetical protein